MKDIECKPHFNFIHRQKYSRKKTLLKFVQRWLASGNKIYEQMIECTHCHSTSTEDLTRDHFLICEMATERKEYRSKNISDTMLQLQTAPYLLEGIMNGMNRYFTSKGKEDKLHRVLKAQETIAWEYFGRENISITIKDEIDKWHERENEISTFIGTG